MTPHLPSFSRLAALATVALLAAGWPAPHSVAAQPGPAGTQALRAQALERFTIVPVAGGSGIGLVPLARIADVRLIEILDGVITIDGTPVSGRELQERLPADASLVVQLSYLDAAARAQLLDAGAPAAAATEPPRAVESIRPPRGPVRQRSRDVVRFAGDVTVGPDDQIDGNVVVFGGNAQIQGSVRGDVVVFGGVLRLSRTADVRGSVVAIGTELVRAPEARVGGDVVDVGPNALRLAFGRVDVPNPIRVFNPSVRRAIGILTTVLRLGLLIILGCLFVAAARAPVDRVAARAAAEPLKAGVVGFLVELLFLPVLAMVSVLLAVSVIGIPLLVLVPVAVLALIVVFLVGFTAVAMRVGQWMGGRIGADRIEGYAAVTLGIVVLLSLAVLARIAFLTGGPLAGVGATLLILGLCVEYAAWTIGLGASVLVRFAPQPPTDSRREPPTATPSPQASLEPPPEPPPATTGEAPPAAE